MNSLGPILDLQNQNLHFNKIPRWFLGTLRFEKHWSTKSNKTQSWPSLQLHVLPPLVTQFQPCCSPHCFSNLASTLPLQSICSHSSFCLECSSLHTSWLIPSPLSEICSLSSSQWAFPWIAQSPLKTVFSRFLDLALIMTFITDLYYLYIASCCIIYHIIVYHIMYKIIIPTNVNSITTRTLSFFFTALFPSPNIQLVFNKYLMNQWLYKTSTSNEQWLRQVSKFVFTDIKKVTWALLNSERTLTIVDK